MGMTDKEGEYSDAQALTATAASTNKINHRQDRNIGIGTAMCVVLTVDVAADFTTGNETYKFDLESDDDEAFGSAVVIASRTILAADLVADSQHVIPIPPDTRFQQWSRMNYTLGGTTPTLTVSAELKPQFAVQAEVSYPAGFDID